MTDRLEMSPEQMIHALNREIENRDLEIARLKKKCDQQTMILRRLTPDQHPDTYFIHTGVGEKDANGMPERLLVVPSYGVDWCQIYVRTDRSTGPEW